MSIEQARAFFEKVKNDEQLSKRWNEAQDKESKLEIARQEGYEFTQEDANQVLEQLSEDELNQVAGGIWANFNDGLSVKAYL
jgi:predicted ribosomally synthesized peptide with nif11-like leader